MKVLHRDELLKVQGGDAWNYTNNPERFQMDGEGEATQIPWPETYWPYD